MSTFLRVSEDLMGFLDAFEKGIIVGVEIDSRDERGGSRRSGRCNFLVRMMFQDLLSVCLKEKCQGTK